MSAVLQAGSSARQDVLGWAVRRFSWCVRRELWENRFIFIAPAAVAVLVVTAYLIGTVHLPEIMRSNPRMNQGGPPPSGLPFSIAAVSVVLTGILTGGFYALGALYNERRDRSILFWKSLPISDRMVVGAKACVALVVVPAATLVITLLMHLAMLGLGAIFAVHSGAGEPAFWTEWPFFQMAVVLAYGFATMMLWLAPLYGWLFMVSAWAKRAPFLWAVLPPLALCVAERVAFNSSVLSNLLADRILGGYDAAFDQTNNFSGTMPLSDIAVMKFFTAPDLWLGLLVAAGFFAVAARLRRLRGPI
jgi:ABC-2 type transport system permease protein